jgi:hypothetical protein
MDKFRPISLRKAVQLKFKIQYNGPTTCVIAQQYSTATFFSLSSYSRKDIRRVFKKNVVFYFLVY